MVRIPYRGGEGWGVGGRGPRGQEQPLLGYQAS